MDGYTPIMVSITVFGHLSITTCISFDFRTRLCHVFLQTLNYFRLTRSESKRKKNKRKKHSGQSFGNLTVLTKDDPTASAATSKTLVLSFCRFDC